MWRISFLVNLKACRLIAGNFTIRWTPSFFDSILSTPLMFWLKPHPSNFEEPPPPPPPSCSQHLWETLVCMYVPSPLMSGRVKWRSKWRSNWHLMDLITMMLSVAPLLWWYHLFRVDIWNSVGQLSKTIFYSTPHIIHGLYHCYWMSFCLFHLFIHCFLNLTFDV